MLTLEGFAKQYLYGARLFGGIDAVFDDGETISVFGGEKSGKTSFLKSLCGAEPAEGRVLLDGEPVRCDTDKIVMVFDDGAVFGFKSVYDNLAYPLKLRGTDKVEIASRVISAAERMGIGACLNMRARNLLPAERRRMSLARLLVRDARLYLIDEPAANLTREDAESLLKDLLPVIKELAAKGATVVYSTSDRAEAFAAADRVVVLVGGEVKQIGTREDILSAPGSVWAAQALDKDYNVAKCVLSDANGTLKLVFGEGGELDIECLRGRLQASYIGHEVLAGWYPDRAAKSGAAAQITSSAVLAVGDRYGYTMYSADGFAERCSERRGFVHTRPEAEAVTLFECKSEFSIMTYAADCGAQGE